MTYGRHPTGRAFWYAHAATEQKRAAETAEDARTYADRAAGEGDVSLTIARALQARAAKQYAVARSAMDAAEELPE